MLRVDANDKPPAANYFRLNTFTTGVGRITSTPVGIQCGNHETACASFFAPNTYVGLTAIGGVDSNTHDEYEFDHWEGAGTGDAGCSVFMNQARTARAVFVKIGTSGP